jgi:putative transposase
VKFAFIEKEKRNHKVAAMCRSLHVSESGFYSWRSRRGCVDRRTPDNEDELVKLVRRLHRKHPTCGRPRLLALVRLEGHAIGANRLRRIMRENALRGRSGRKARHPEHRPQTRLPPAPNLLERNFSIDAPNKVWTGDITELCVGQARLRMAVVLDLYSRRVVGWKLDAQMNTSLVIGAIRSAVRRRRPPEGLIFHSDQGVQYASMRYRAVLRALGMRQSMSRRGNCWDNAPTESFFATLKKDLVYGRSWANVAELAAAIVRYITHYNNHRPHTSLGLRSPRDYELLLSA